MNANYEFTETFLRKEYPKLWECVYPRVYDNLGNFHSPKLAACCLGNAVLAAMRLGLDNTGARNQFLAACCADAHGVPTFFVTGAMLRACANTDLPDDMKWTDIPMPHPGMVFMFERGSIKHKTAGEVGFVAIGRLRNNSKIHHRFLGAEFNRNVPVGAFVSMFMAHETAELYTYDISLSENSPQVKDIERANNWLERQGEELAAPMAEEESKFNQWLAILAMKIILVMNARPEQVSTGQKLRTVKSKHPGQAPREFWSPNIVGKNYKVETSVEQSTDGIGKMRMHWRRGHFTRQPYGPKHSLRKTIWLEPMLIGEVRN